MSELTTEQIEAYKRRLFSHILPEDEGVGSIGDMEARFNQMVQIPMYTPTVNIRELILSTINRTEGV